MSQIVNEMIEKGQLHQLSKKWELKQPNCQPAQRKGTPISFGKLTTLFLEIALGVLLTLIILFAEKIHSIFRPVNQHHQMVFKNSDSTNKSKLFLKYLKDSKDNLQRCNRKNVESWVELNLLIEQVENKLKQKL